jgi:hypothetical protein
MMADFDIWQVIICNHAFKHKIAEDKFNPEVTNIYFPEFEFVKSNTISIVIDKRL